MTGYDDDALSTNTVLAAIANNANPRHRAITTHSPRGARRMQLLDRMPLADAIDITAAVYIGPGSEWECPITFSDVGAQYPSLDHPAIARMIQQDFKPLALTGSLHFPNWRHLGGERGPATFIYRPIAAIVADLRGRDLACTCPLDEACHGDVLLRLANPEHQCPECAQGKHRNCTEITLDSDDLWTPCNCHTITQHTIPTATALAAARQEAANRP
jgi:hypothetical protein